MGVAAWAPLIKMTIVKLISFGDLNFKNYHVPLGFLKLFSIQKSLCHKKYKMRPCSGVAAEGWPWGGTAVWAPLTLKWSRYRALPLVVKGGAYGP